MSEVILDVRERDEFDAEHVPGSVSVPLSHLASVAPGVLEQLREKNIVLMCRSGARAQQALSEIQRLGFGDKIVLRVYEGGILAWKKQGKETVQRKKGHLPILRQVQLAAGLLILGSLAGAYFISPAFLGLTAFVGAGLTLAGTTGFCGMANLLALMPWNKNVPTTAEELCSVSPSSNDCKKESL